MELVPVRDGRQPHHVLFLIAALIAGIAGTADHGTQSPITRQLMPDGLAVVWYALLALAAVITLAGIAASGKRVVLGLLIERMGSLLIGGLCIAYGLAALGLLGRAAIVGGLVTLAFGIASAIRSHQIGRDLHSVRRVLRER